MIQDKAMLVELTIHQWTASKHDKSVSTEVEQKHGAVDAGRYNKRLVNRDELKALQQQAGRIRDFHYQRTLPWTDTGPRLLSSKGFLDYTNEMRKMIEEFDRLADEFKDRYPTLRTEARVRLGSLYKPEDYPPESDIRQRFGIVTRFSAIPDAKDFRVEVGAEEVERIRRDITKSLEESQRAALKDCWNRLREVVSRISEKLADQDAVFRDSLIENARMLVNLLPKLVVTEDAELEAMRIEVEDKLLVSPDHLRRNKRLRAQTADAADDILRRMAPWAVRDAA